MLTRAGPRQLLLQPPAARRASCASRPRSLARAEASPSSGEDAEKKKPKFVRSQAQQQLADLDAAVTDAQRALGEGLLNALGPLADALRLRPRGAPKLASGQVAGWSLEADALAAAGLRSVPPAEALALQQAGWVLLDVSPAEDYAECHAAGSVSAPLLAYDTTASLKTLLFASLAVKGTREDPAGYLAAARAAAGAAPGVVLACAAGGSLRKTTNFPSGQASRSLRAAYLLACAPADGDDHVPAGRVRHLAGGLSAWFSQGLPGEGDAQVWDARRGRVPPVEGPMYAQDDPSLS